MSVTLPNPRRSLVDKFKYFMLKAFDCLRVIAEHARDFVHRRTVTDVLPPLLSFFRTLEVMVKDRDKQHTMAANQSR